MQETEKEEVSMRYLTCLFLFVFLISAFGQVANTEEQYQKMYKKYSGYFHLQRARYLLDYPGATFIYKDDLKLFFSKLPEERYLKAAAEANLAIENPNGLEEEDLKFVKYTFPEGEIAFSFGEWSYAPRLENNHGIRVG